MRDFVKVAEASDVPEGSGKVVELDGAEIALFNVAGRIYATSNVCPHKGGPLGEGTLEETTVTCPWHGWQFDVSTGVCAAIPTKRVQVFEVKVENGSVYVRSDGEGV